MLPYQIAKSQAIAPSVDLKQKTDDSLYLIRLFDDHRPTSRSSRPFDTYRPLVQPLLESTSPSLTTSFKMPSSRDSPATSRTVSTSSDGSPALYLSPRSPTWPASPSVCL